MSRQLLNTLFVMTPGAYARLDGDTAVVEHEGQRLVQAPLHQIGSVVAFEGVGVSTALLMRCAEDGRSVTLLDYAGRFKARVEGPESGNVLLRRAQFQASLDPVGSASIARNIVGGKIRNARQTLQRAARDARDAEAGAELRSAAQGLAAMLESLPSAADLDAIRGVEGNAASIYFAAFGRMITRPPAEFAFKVRTRRPPRDRVNALLSFLYALLQSDCCAAAEGVGLDPQVGFLHAVRPGRPALGLDLMEEFRSVVSDRLALNLINRRQLTPDHFEERRGGSVLLSEDGRRTVLVAYQTRKKEEVNHPFLQARVPIGLLPHVQARLLARHLRGDMQGYLPYVAR